MDCKKSKFYVKKNTKGTKERRGSVLKVKIALSNPLIFKMEDFPVNEIKKKFSVFIPVVSIDNDG